MIELVFVIVVVGILAAMTKTSSIIVKALLL